MAVLRELVENQITNEQRHNEEEEFEHADDDNVQTIRTIVAHELERVKEEDQRRQRTELGQPRIPELMSMDTNVTKGDEPPRCRQGSTSPKPSAIIDELTQRLNSRSN